MMILLRIMMATEKMLTKESFQNDCYPNRKEHLWKGEDVGDATPVIGDGNEVKAHNTLVLAVRRKLSEMVEDKEVLSIITFS